MTDTEKQNEIKKDLPADLSAEASAKTGASKEEKKETGGPSSAAPKREERRPGGFRGKKQFGKGGRGGKRGPRRGDKGERFKPEFEQKIIDIRRVARVVAGGRRFSFRVSIVLGNRKGSVGVGMGKGTDTALAIEKAVKNARKNMKTIKLNKNMSIPHEVKAKYASSEVQIMPAPGKGLVAGSSIRTVLDLAGATDVTAKVITRSKNKLNNARVAIIALSELKG